MTRFSVLLILVGLVLGPGYYAWAAFFSGGKVAEHRLGEKGARWTLPSGDVMRFSNANTFEPVELALDPAMNTVGLALVFEVVGDVRVEPVRGNAYQALLLADGQPAGGETGDHQPRDQSRPGSALVGAGRDRRRAERRHVHVRARGDQAARAAAHGHQPAGAAERRPRARMEVVWSGVALLVAGVVAFFFATRR